MGANSYNICPRCGNSNSLSAKYCSRCGGQLKVPEEPVVCHKCHTRNSPMANFCRNCGAELKVGYQTKICPKCGKEVDAHDNVCTCGYSFVTLQQTAPSKNPLPAGAVPVSSYGKSKKVYITKGGRAWAIVALIVLMLFAYYILMPSNSGELSLRPSALNGFDKGIAVDEITLYGGNYLYMLFAAMGNGGLATIGSANVLIAVLVAMTAIAMIAQFAVSFVRAVTGRRPKRFGWYYLAMFCITLIAVGLITLFNNITVGSAFMQSVAGAFRLPEGAILGNALWAIPLYNLLFFLLFLASKARYLKEKK